MTGCARCRRPSLLNVCRRCRRALYLESASGRHVAARVGGGRSANLLPSGRGPAEIAAGGSNPPLSVVPAPPAAFKGRRRG